MAELAVGQVWEDSQAASFGMPRPVTLSVIRELHLDDGEVWVATPGQDPNESQAVPVSFFDTCVLLDGVEADYAGWKASGSQGDKP